MSERNPVLVIHGVGNRGNEEGFDTQVDDLQRVVDPSKKHVRLIPVFWGGLGADKTRYMPTLPDPGDHEVRSDDSADRAVPPQPEVGLALLGSAAADGPDAMTIVADAAGGGGTHEVRSEDPEIRDAVQETWSDLTWLPRVTDEPTLRSAGRIVREAVEQSRDGTASTGHEVRGGLEVRDGFEVRGFGKVRDIVGGVLRGVDDLIGRVVGEVGGRLNHQLRSSLGAEFIGFFGDIFAYNHHAHEVHRCVREVLDAEAPGHGTAERPISAIAHSLGGVILFDMAVAGDDPLHLDAFITFGSQAPFFHVIDPRAGLPPYEADQITLPPTIRRWINLWEPLDLLAFVASRIFDLNDKSDPVDRMVPYDAGSSLWTHSSYWEADALAAAIREAFSLP